LREITPGHVERYAARRRAEGLADASVNRELTFLRCVFNVAIADEKTDANPVLRKCFVKENNQRVRYLTAEEEPRLREEMGEDEWSKVVVAMNTGLRQGNQFHLRWTEVNFDTGMITVKRSKSGESYHVPMNDEVRAILRALPSRLRSEWVFPTIAAPLVLQLRAVDGACWQTTYPIGNLDFWYRRLSARGGQP
jgi:integrase